MRLSYLRRFPRNVLSLSFHQSGARCLHQSKLGFPRLYPVRCGPVPRILKAPLMLSNRKHLIYWKIGNCYSCKSQFYLHIVIRLEMEV